MSIGLIDSGIGGLTVLYALRKEYPKCDFVYIGDTLYAPYGNQNEDTLRRRIAGLMAFLGAKGVQAAVLACNTGSVMTFNQPFWGDFSSDCGNIPLLRVLPPIERALKETSGKVLLLSTILTAHSPYIKERENSRLIVKPMGKLATLVEAVAPNFFILKDFLYELLLPYDDCEAVILGCTHYVYLTSILKEIFPSKKIYDGSSCVIQNCARYIHNRGESLSENANTQCGGENASEQCGGECPSEQCGGKEGPAHGESGRIDFYITGENNINYRSLLENMHTYL